MNGVRVIDYLYINSEDINYGGTVIELIDNLKLYDNDKLVYMYNVNEDSLFGVSTNEFTSISEDVDNHLLIGDIRTELTSTVSQLVKNLIEIVTNDVYDSYGNCHLIEGHSEVYISKGDEKCKLIGVSDSEGYPIIMTK